MRRTATTKWILLAAAVVAGCAGQSYYKVKQAMDPKPSLALIFRNSGVTKAGAKPETEALPAAYEEIADAIAPVFQQKLGLPSVKVYKGKVNALALSEQAAAEVIVEGKWIEKFNPKQPNSKLGAYYSYTYTCTVQVNFVDMDALRAKVTAPAADDPQRAEFEKKKAMWAKMGVDMEKAAAAQIGKEPLPYLSTTTIADVGGGAARMTPQVQRLADLKGLVDVGKLYPRVRSAAIKGAGKLADQILTSKPPES